MTQGVTRDALQRKVLSGEIGAEDLERFVEGVA